MRYKKKVGGKQNPSFCTGQKGSISTSGFDTFIPRQFLRIQYLFKFFTHSYKINSRMLIIMLNIRSNIQIPLFPKLRCIYLLENIFRTFKLQTTHSGYLQYELKIYDYCSVYLDEKLTKSKMSIRPSDINSIT